LKSSGRNKIIYPTIKVTPRTQSKDGEKMRRGFQALVNKRSPKMKMSPTIFMTAVMPAIFSKLEFTLTMNKIPAINSTVVTENITARRYFFDSGILLVS